MRPFRPILMSALLLLVAAPPAIVSARPKISTDQMAYALGKNLGLAAIGHDQNAPKTAVDSLFHKAEIIAKAMGGVVPPLPVKTGARAKDSAAVLHYLLRGAGKPLQATIKVRHGLKAAALFELATKASILAMIYVPGDSLSSSAAVGIERAAIKGGVPSAIWSPLVIKVRAKAPYTQVKGAVFDMHKAMDRHLAG